MTRSAETSRNMTRWIWWLVGAGLVLAGLIALSIRPPAASPVNTGTEAPALTEPDAHLNDPDSPPPVVPPDEAPAGPGTETEPAAPPPPSVQAVPPPQATDLPADHPVVADPAGPQTTIQWLGVACVYIHSPGGSTLVLDPFDGSAAGLRDPQIGSHLVATSTSGPLHGELNSVHSFPGDRRVVVDDSPASRGDLTLSPVPLNGTSRAFVVESGGLRILHLGQPENAQAGVLRRFAGKIDVLLVAVGDAPVRAAEAARTVAPRLVIPIKQSRGSQASSSSALERFIGATDYAVTRQSTDVVLLSRASLPPKAEILVLQFRP